MSGAASALVTVTMAKKRTRQAWSRLSWTPNSARAPQLATTRPPRLPLLPVRIGAPATARSGCSTASRHQEPSRRARPKRTPTKRSLCRSRSRRCSPKILRRQVMDLEVTMPSPFVKRQLLSRILHRLSSQRTPQQSLRLSNEIRSGFSCVQNVDLLDLSNCMCINIRSKFVVYQTRLLHWKKRVVFCDATNAMFLI